MINSSKNHETHYLCTIKHLPDELKMQADQKAIEINPMNEPKIELAAKVRKLWPKSGASLTVQFIDNLLPQVELRTRILSHMNAWSQYGNINFKEVTSGGQVRITLRTDHPDGMYWSYLGTDILLIPSNEPTMCLGGFNMNTEEKEYRRVVRHETGHTLGYEHEQLRKEIVYKIDRQKAIDYFEKWEGWLPGDTERNVLIPLEDSEIITTKNADPTSIMCYSLPGEIMKDGEPVVGGDDISRDDGDLTSKLYPKKA